MRTLQPFTTLITIALLGITAASAWSAEAISRGTAPAAQPTPAPAAGIRQGWYPPPPGRGSYAQPPQSSVQPTPYGAWPQYHRQPEPYQAAQPATAESPADDKLKQTQKQLAAKTSELKQVRSSLAQSRASLKESREAAKALEKKLAEVTKAQAALQARVTELTEELKVSNAKLKRHRQQLTSDQQLIRTLIADRARLRNDVANLDFRLARLLADLQASTDALQQAQAEPATCLEQLSEVTAQSAACSNELADQKARLKSHQTTLRDTEQELAAADAERNGLQSELAACRQELGRAKAALKTTRSEREVLRAKPAAAAAAIPTAQDEASDTDEDGVPDIIDLCPNTGEGIAVAPTGCVPGAAITLAGVDFPYDSHELTDAAQRVLDRIAGILKQQTDLRVEVAGHTDTTGDPARNQWLSLQRAEAVMDYLVSQGVDPEHIGAAGYGGQQPASTGAPGKAAQKNYRIELRPMN